MAFFENPSGPLSTDYYRVSSPLFYHISEFKLLVIRSILQLGIDVLYSDSDVVVYQNPVPVIQAIPFESMVFQKDVTISTGFFYALSSQSSICFLNRSLELIQNKHMTDQNAFLQLFGETHTQPSILPVSQFQSGEVFFASHQYLWDKVSPSIVMMHNNFILGSVCKDYRMLEMNYTRQRTKDPEDTRYLTAESLPFDTLSLRKELKRLIAIANRLKRVLIVPPVSCSIGKGFCTIANREFLSCFADVLGEATEGFRESVGVGAMIHL